ncbi:MAG: DNA gyrase inhibitor YacG [Pseudomonadota bacterium]
MSEPRVKSGRCPICAAPTVRDMRPFCSKRCADIDLGRWLTGAYAIPVEDGEDDETVRPANRDDGDDADDGDDWNDDR